MASLGIPCGGTTPWLLNRNRPVLYSVKVYCDVFGLLENSLQVLHSLRPLNAYIRIPNFHFLTLLPWPASAELLPLASAQHRLSQWRPLFQQPVYWSTRLYDNGGEPYRSDYWRRPERLRSEKTECPNAGGYQRQHYEIARYRGYQEDSKG